MKKKDVNLEDTVELAVETPVDATCAEEGAPVSEDAKNVEALVDEVEKQPVDQTAALNEEIALQRDKYVRLMAEFDNFKRRSAREFEKIVASANKNLMVDVIDIRNNFERALGMADEKGDFAEFIKGMRLLFTKFDDNLAKNGLSVFGAVGDAFNPEIHDAMMQMPSGDVAKGVIMQIFEKGYSLNGTVICHAKVVVSSGPAEE